MDPDEVDRRVLAALLADGRATASELGDVAGVGPSTASWRKDLLEAVDVIRGYEPTIDYETLDYEVTAVFHLDVEPSAREAVRETLCDRPQLHTVYEVTDEHDIVAVGKFPDERALDGTLHRLRGDSRIARVSVDVARPVKEFEWFPPE
jgi:DNA-binding Lrp family transcriptional regulator